MSQDPEDETEDDEVPCPPPTSREAEEALLIFRHYFEAKYSAKKELQLVNKLQCSLTEYAIRSYRQSSITDFLC